MTSSRRGTPREIEPALCGCGSDWFVLDGGADGDSYPNGAVRLNDDGEVIAYGGAPVCARCGERWLPRQDRLRAIE